MSAPARRSEQAARRRWLGAAAYDVHVGLSRTAGQITHHIAADVDLERDKLIKDLERAGVLSGVYWVDSFHGEVQGNNRGGDPWHTDGRIAVGVRAIPHAPQPAAPTPASRPNHFCSKKG